MQDRLFKNETNHNKPFVFDEEVTKVFDDMISRSVPLYSEILNMITSIVKQHINDQSYIYDLGCSTGNTFINFQDHLNLKQCKLIGIDNSEEMLKIARKKSVNMNASFIKHDLKQPIKLKSCDVIIINLVLQFLPIKNREKLIQTCFDALNTGGNLIIVEKTLPNNDSLEALFKNSYYDYKKQNGYSEKEIIGKEKSLKNVLVPVKKSHYVSLLNDIGFTKIEEFFKWFNFCGIMAIKK